MARNIVNLAQVSKSFGTRTVLDSVSLGLSDGERVGIVGRNGGGKSTLLRVVAGTELPDAGRVTRVGGLQLAVVDQRAQFPAGATVRAVVVGEQADHRWAGDAAVREILHGLGLTSAATTVDLQAPVDRLSGGERRRVDLARALVQPAELLLLDEPTNHLDIEAIAWLAGHLRSRRGGLLVVTHDRWFLDEVCTATWEVGDGSVRQYDGGYAAYVLARAERARSADRGEARRQNLLRKELAWLRRGAPARSAKPKFRIEAAEALIADLPPIRRDVELVSIAAQRLGRTVYDVEDVVVRAGSKLLLDHVTWRVGPGDRIGVVGANGSGKTHLLRLLTGQLAPSSGRVQVGQTVRAGYLSQDVAELPEGARLLEAVQEVRSAATVDGVDQSAGQLLERLDFTSAQHWTPVAQLSGGERRRLQLLRVLLTEPNVLLLDEPTNDLDTDTLPAVEDLLDGWPGTVIVVSHDRYLLERVCSSTVALLGDGSLVALPGGVDQFLAMRAAQSARSLPVPATGTSARSSAGPDSSAGAGDDRAHRRELARLERTVARLEQKEAALHLELAERANDYAAVRELDTQLRAVSAERGAAEDAWLRLSSS